MLQSVLSVRQSSRAQRHIQCAQSATHLTSPSTVLSGQRSCSLLDSSAGVNRCFLLGLNTLDSNNFMHACPTTCPAMSAAHAITCQSM